MLKEIMQIKSPCDVLLNLINISFSALATYLKLQRKLEEYLFIPTKPPAAPHLLICRFPRFQCTYIDLNSHFLFK